MSNKNMFNIWIIHMFKTCALLCVRDVCSFNMGKMWYWIFVWDIRTCYLCIGEAFIGQKSVVLRSLEISLFAYLFVYIFIYFVFVCHLFNFTLENSCSSIWRRCWWKKHKQQENLIETGGESIMTIYPR